MSIIFDLDRIDAPEYLQPLMRKVAESIAEGVEDAAEELLVADHGEVLEHPLTDDLRVFLTGVHEFLNAPEERNPELRDDPRFLLGVEFATIATAGVLDGA